MPLLAGALLCLLVALWGGLALLGIKAPLPHAAFAAGHGPLMTLGFLGTLVALERAVALGRPWAYAAPALAVSGGLATAAGQADPLGRILLTAAGGWLIAVYLVLLGRSPSGEVLLQLTGAVAWYSGGLLWLAGRDVRDIVPWLAAFLVLTIVGERLELARIAFPRRRVVNGSMAAVAGLAAGTVASAVVPDIGWRVAGGGLLLLAAWLARHDVARRTVRGSGLPRYTAWCLLVGYAWLAVAGVLWAAGGLQDDGGRYDAALHALFLGFVISLVFGHAPVILPAVLRVRLPYHPVLYAPVVLLHTTLLVRVTGDLIGVDALRTAGGVLGEVALLAFAGCAVAATRLVRKPANKPGKEPL
ncbi:hypothetical protein TH66_09865 [Carbonactinospora thermoautotrophica]|uniref:Uncharacterized protein n=1 Tax=Carbonactinospora thermoautotrophica TaxID=1469144 RepID=A0A132NE27_9ACTN|nr:hypothetical protein TH66_09865 [Carbonactinospora thermoautotrophica]KWX08384.1 hypothetical protein TR74_15230 [Carbonactinospora thermoautotrophica]